MAAFTLIELVVILGIIALLSGLFLANYTGSSDNARVQLAAQDLVRDLRSAQADSLAYVKYGAAWPAGGWGVHLDMATSSYLVFADANNNSIYDDGEADTDFGGRSLSFPDNVHIFTLSAGPIVDITFGTSSPQAWIYNGTAMSNNLNIDLRNDVTGATSTVKVNFLGLIETVDK